jgi:heme A synthase
MQRSRWIMVLVIFSVVYFYANALVGGWLLGSILPHLATVKPPLISFLLYLNSFILGTLVALLPAYLIVKLKFPSAIIFAFLVGIPLVVSSVWFRLNYVTPVTDPYNMLSTPSAIVRQVYQNLVNVSVLPLWVWVFDRMWPSNKKRNRTASPPVL